MKNRIHYIIVTLLASCLLSVGCQDVEEPAKMTTPVVITNAVSDISLTGARVSGSVSSTSKCMFLLSTRLDLLDAVEVSAQLTDTDGVYIAMLSNLEANTTYYVALCATDGHAKVIGNIQSFQTIAGLGIAQVTLDKWESIGNVSNFTESPLGTFIYSIIGGISIRLDESNLKIVYEDNQWKLPRTIGFESMKKKIYAYYPYDETAENPDRILVTANTDFLYGNSEELDEMHSSAMITLHHAMAKVTFEISLSEESNTAFVLNSVSLRNTDTAHQQIAAQANFDLLTATMTSQDVPGHEGLTVTCDTSLEAGNTATIDLYVIPTAFSAGEVELHLYNDRNEATSSPLAAMTWEAGRHYVCPVTISSTGLQIGEIRVEDWQNNEEGSIIIKK